MIPPSSTFLRIAFCLSVTLLLHVPGGQLFSHLHTADLIVRSLNLHGIYGGNFFVLGRLFAIGISSKGLGHILFVESLFLPFSTIYLNF